MIKCRFFCALVCLFFLGCSKPSDEQKKISEILMLQTKAKTVINDSSLIYLKQADGLLNTLKTPSDSLLIENVFIKGYYYNRTSQLDSAAFYYHSTLDKIIDTTQSYRMITYFRNAWENDFNNEKYTNVISAANKFMELYKGSQNYKDLLFAYNIKERVYLRMGDLEQALAMNTKAQEMAQLTNNEAMSDITNFAKSDYLFKMNKKQEAMHLLDSLSKKRSSYSNEINRQFFLQYGLLNDESNNFNLAIENYKSALVYTKRNKEDDNFNRNMGWLYNNISEAYIDLKKYDIAEKYLDSSQSYVSNTTDTELISVFGKQRLTVNYKMGKELSNVLPVFDNLIRNQDKTYEKRMNEQLFALTSANEKEKVLVQEKQDAEIESLKSQTRFLYLLGLSFVLAILAYLYYQRRRHKFEKQSFYMQQRLLRSQMSPHFTFNTLYAIQNKVKEDQEGAINYLLKFSKLLRLILENSTHNYVQFEKEIESLKNYLDLQLLRFPSLFSYNIMLDNIEETDLIFIPPMLIQPFVENCIIHAFSGIDYKGEIKILLSKQDNKLACTIEDNGIGLSHSKQLDSKTSLSTHLISDFIFKATKTEVEITDKVNENTSGVRVKFLIPYKLTEHD